MNWDEYYLNICRALSANSKCMSRQIGAIIVKDKSIISTGYNGPSRGVSHCSERYENDLKLIEAIKEKYGPDYINNLDQYKKMCPRRVLEFKSGEGLKWCIAGHSERNTIVNAARHGICIKGGTLYCNCPIPCTPCLVEIINAGIEEIVVEKLESYDIMGIWLIEQSKIRVREFNIKK